MAKKENIKKTAKKSVKKVMAKKIENVTESIVDNIDNIDTTNSINSEEIDLENEIAVEGPELNYEELYKEETNEIVTEKELENENSSKFNTISENEKVEENKEKIEESEKVNNERVNTRINNLFGYLWNGQEMDY